MSLTIETIGQYLKQYGWEYEVHDEQLLATGFRGKSAVFRIFAQVADPWLVLAIAPYVPRPAPDCRDRFCRYLLRLNYEINLVKIGMDPDGDVALSVELRAADLRFEDFAMALDALTFCADEYYLSLANLAQDTAYRPALDLEIPDETAP